MIAGSGYGSKKRKIRFVTSHARKCHRLRRLCRKHSNNVARHDKAPVKSTLLLRDMSFIML